MIEISSDTWKAVRSVCEEGMEASRNTLERHGLPLAESEYERGRISAFRDIADLGAPRKIDKPEPTSTTANLRKDRSGY